MREERILKEIKANILADRKEASYRELKEKERMNNYKKMKSEMILFRFDRLCPIVMFGFMLINFYLDMQDKVNFNGFIYTGRTFMILNISFLAIMYLQDRHNKKVLRKYKGKI